MGKTNCYFYIQKKESKGITFCVDKKKNCFDIKFKVALPVKKESISKLPFFSLLNEKGVLKQFIKAINKHSEEEARRYLSNTVKNRISMEEAYTLFSDGGNYKSLISIPMYDNGKYNTLSIALGNSEEVIQVSMIEEPDHFGQWKIIQIERG